jgi:hypothetical protein
VQGLAFCPACVLCSVCCVVCTVCHVIACNATSRRDVPALRRGRADHSWALIGGIPHQPNRVRPASSISRRPTPPQCETPSPTDGGPPAMKTLAHRSPSLCLLSLTHSLTNPHSTTRTSTSIHLTIDDSHPLQHALTSPRQACSTRRGSSGTATLPAEPAQR